MCILSVVPSIIFTQFENSLFHMMRFSATFLLIAIGVGLMVCSWFIWNGYKVLLEEGEYTRETKQIQNKRRGWLSVYWVLVTALYLVISYFTRAWGIIWIILMVARVLFPVLKTSRFKDS